MIYQDRLHDLKAIRYSVQFKKSKYFLSFFRDTFAEQNIQKSVKKIAFVLIIIIYVFDWILFC